MTNAELKLHLQLETYFLYQGSEQDSQGRWRCLRPNQHANGDAHHSVTITKGYATCWSQKCFGEKGGDIFNVIGIVEGLTEFAAQKRRAEELVAIAEVQTPCRIRRSYRWEDEVGNVAYKIRWDTDDKNKFAWALDPEGRRSGKGKCQPTLYKLDEMKCAAHVIQCEGEHDADTINEMLVELGIKDVVATTTPNGAADVQEKYLQPLYGKSTVFLSGDNDKAGRGYVQRCGAVLQGHIPNLRHLIVPETYKDWHEWKDGGARAKDIQKLLESAPLYLAESSTLADPICKFAPVIASQLCDEPEPGIPEWVWQDFVSRGSLSILAAKPKTGKTTLIYELGVKVTMGQPFLSRATQGGGVLLIAVEEQRRDIRRRLQDLGAENLGNLHLHIGPLEPTTDIYHAMAEYIRQNEITLVIVDSLNTFWHVNDENNAQAVTQAVRPLLNLARESEAAVLLIHHARKSEGEYGDEIRGSSALFSLADVALILKRHEAKTQRKLTAVSRYAETPSELILELRDCGYEALGDPATIGKAAKIITVRNVLSDVPTSAPELGTRAGVSRGVAYKILDQLMTEGHAVRTGTGKRSDPYLYARSVSISPIGNRGVNETKCPGSADRGTTVLPGELVSFGGPTPKGETKQQDLSDVECVSFEGNGSQTNRNDLEGNEHIEEVVLDVD